MLVYYQHISIDKVRKEIKQYNLEEFKIQFNNQIDNYVNKNNFNNEIRKEMYKMASVYFEGVRPGEYIRLADCEWGVEEIND